MKTIDTTGKRWVRMAKAHDRYVLPAFQYFVAQGWKFEDVKEAFRKLGIDSNIRRTR